MSDFSLIVDAFNYLSHLPSGGKVIAGDFNAPSINWSSFKSPSSFLTFMSCLREGQWSQHVSSPTRGNNILDLIFTTGISRVSASVSSNFPGSDHRLVTCHISRNHSADPSLSTPASFFFNWKILPSLLRSYDWTEFFLSSDPQLAANMFYSNLKSCVNKARQPYFSSTHRRSVLSKLELKLSRLKRLFSSNSDFSLIMQMDRLTQAIRIKKDAALVLQERKALQHSNLALSLATLLKSRIPKPSSSIRLLILSDNTTLDSPAQIAEAFNSVFVSSFSTDTSPHVPSPSLLSSTTLADITVELKDIKFLLSSIKPSVRLGSDEIPPTALTSGGPDVPLLLLNLFNLSLKYGTFPSQWKTSVIIPLHKKGPTHNPNNYRPINTTPIVSRLFEKLVKKPLVGYLLTNNLINDKQHGFLQSRSCNSCHFDFFNLFTKAADKGHSVIIVYLDMTKAFDRVPHGKLLGKLKSIGIIDPLLSWFASYLTSRLQVVCIDGHRSSPKPVSSGVIQGSVLGPVLFLIYVNDLFRVIRYGTPFLFADDIKIIYDFERDTLLSVLSKISYDLLSLSSWCQSWGMSFSAEKSSVLTFKCNVPPNVLSIDGQIIHHSSSVRDLGLQYSSSFTFSEHSALQVAKAKRSMGLVLKSFRLRECKLLLFKMLTRPLLEYCPLVFSSMNKSDKIAIESVQRSFTKLLLGSNCFLSYQERCHLLKLEPLWLRCIKLNLVFLYKLLQRNTFSCTAINFQADSSYALRNKDNRLPMPVPKTSLRSHFFLHVYSKLWNQLPLRIRQCSSINSFKRLLAEFLTVEKLLRLSNTFISLQSAFEIGVNL
ncbi:RNA-directed DNA polymerase [Streptococcus dysgalactiae subsp. equisimilis]|nr:RNA-directed DNA polymerase [Streptococcus dysgalactiae subsp. equisimilis]